MLSPLMILSLDQGKFTPAPRSVGPFDARLLEDIADCSAEPKVPPTADPQTAGLMAFIRKKLLLWQARSVNRPLPQPAQLHRLKP